MCGIVGALAFGKVDKSSEQARREAIAFLTTYLPRVTMERGKDATGVAALFSDGNFLGLKMGIPAVEFISRYGGAKDDYEGFLKVVRNYPKPLSVVLGHCRKATVGNTYENKNNQPVQVGNTVIIHNGTIENYDIVCEKLHYERHGDVDSEVIAHLANQYSDNGRSPFTIDLLQKISSKLDGSYSVLGFNGNNPFQVFQLKSSRPAETVLIKPLRLVLIASERSFLENALFEYNLFTKCFARMDNLPFLTKEDLEFCYVTEGSLRVWDLSVDIEARTTLSDLYVEGRTLNVESELKAKTQSSTQPYYYNYRAGSVSTKSQEKVSYWQEPAAAKVHKDSFKRQLTEDAFVWSAKLDRYVKTQDCPAINETIEVDIKTGKILNEEKNVQQAEAKKEECLLLTMGTREAINSTVKDDAVPLEIMDIADEVKGGENEEKREESKNTSDESTITTATEVEVDSRTDIAALVKAREYADGLKKFTGDEDLMVELDIDSEDFLKSVPPFAIANRIMKYFAGKFFYHGYVQGKEDTQKEAGRKVAKKVNILKTIVAVLFRTLDKNGKKEISRNMEPVFKSMPAFLRLTEVNEIEECVSEEIKPCMSFQIMRSIFQKSKKNAN